ncbi:hypothetical protein BX661DRAFT_92128, partial [Kickxella alabastrina]|uniref:uncharacterized protein n=1 Tax=Kickxella alabastrina TaxID=61397 RepID=UPI00221F6DE5
LFEHPFFLILSSLSLSLYFQSFTFIHSFYSFFSKLTMSSTNIPSSNISAVYNANLSKFSPLSPVENIGEVFGPPTYMGSSLDHLIRRDDPDFANQMPGIVLGNNDNADSAGQPHFYLAYDGNDASGNKILWFQVQVNTDGDEVIMSHGWRP